MLIGDLVRGRRTGHEYDPAAVDRSAMAGFGHVPGITLEEALRRSLSASDRSRERQAGEIARLRAEVKRLKAEALNAAEG